MKHLCEKIFKVFAIVSMAVVLGLILFLFGYIFINGAETISIEFLTQAPSGAILGESGGIFPAIIGSLAFTTTAVVLGGITAFAAAIYMVFYPKSHLAGVIIKNTIHSISGIPSIVLGLFAYSFLVKELELGRCILSSGIALAIMSMPFMEVRMGKIFREIPAEVVQASLNMGCSIRYTLFHLVLPQALPEIISALILGAGYVMGATAPLIFTGAVAYAAVPGSIFEPAMALPMHLYLLVAQGATSLPMAYGTAFVMMAMLLTGNMLSTILIKRRSRKWMKS